MQSRLQCRTAILGESAGIGPAAAHLAAERGAQVVRGGRDRDRDRLDAAAAVIATLRAAGEALPSLSGHGSVTLTGGDTAQAGFAGTDEPAAVNGVVEAAVVPLARAGPRRVNAGPPGVIVAEWWDSLGGHRDTGDSGSPDRSCGRIRQAPLPAGKG